MKNLQNKNIDTGVSLISGRGGGKCVCKKKKVVLYKSSEAAQQESEASNKITIVKKITSVT